MSVIRWWGLFACLFAAAAACNVHGDVDAKSVTSGGAGREQAAQGHRFCGWLHEFLGDPASTELGYDTFAEHAEEFDAVHPKWWRVASPTTFENHPRGRETPYGGFHDGRVLEHTTPGGGRTKLIPLIAAMDAPDVAAVHVMLHDVELRRKHVAGVVDLVMSNGYDGIDIDYEHLTSALGPNETVEAERAAFSAFIAELGHALHARGKALSLAVPVVTGPEGGAFDYEALSAAADQVHVMSYDFHWYGGPHPGPVAPLAWVKQAVSYIGSIEGGARRPKFILGLPNYGLLGKESVGCCEPLRKCFELVGEDYETSSDHMSQCSLALGEHLASGRTPNRVLASGEHVFFEDLLSLEEKVMAAKEGSLGGVTYWSIGGEPEGFFAMIKRHIPR